MNEKERYKEAAAHTLAGFQLVEERLKQYIGYYYDAVRSLLRGQLSFQYTREEINEAALERLTQIFAKITTNEDLVKRIRILIKHRNEVAHRALVYLYGEPKSDREFKADTEAFIEVSEKLGVILDDLLRETLKVYSLINHADSRVA